MYELRLHLTYETSKCEAVWFRSSDIAEYSNFAVVRNPGDGSGQGRSHGKTGAGLLYGQTGHGQTRQDRVAQG